MEPVTAAAHPNLALVKFWGKADDELNIPANSSISISLSGATTTTTVRFASELEVDRITINGRSAERPAFERVTRHLDRVRALAGIEQRAVIESSNDFPASAGIASSSSAFAALTLSATRAAGLDLDQKQLSILARKGSGSACRSIHGGFVEWTAGRSDETSYAQQIAPPEHWDIGVTTVVLDTRPKAVSSSAGHRAAWTSPLFRARLDAVPSALTEVRSALRSRDISSLGQAVEREAVSMHAVAMTSQLEGSGWLSGLYYWAPETLRVIHAVQSWRKRGLETYLTIDAGPNPHLLYEGAYQNELDRELAPLLRELGASSFVSRPGRGAWITG